MFEIRTEDVNRREMLQYLGYNGQNLGSDWETQIDEAVADCISHSNPRVVWREFSLLALEKEQVFLADFAKPLKGVAIRQHLEGAGSAFLFAATLGASLERFMQSLRHQEMARLLLVDAAAGACIEALCDKAEEYIRDIVEQKGGYLGPRFSPGYGDFPLEFQPVLLQALDAEKRIGLNCTAENLLIPRKSVTAVLGVFKSRADINQQNPCAACLLRATCQKRKDGVCCGYPKTNGK